MSSAASGAPASAAGIALLHSPLLGPMSWLTAAELLRQRGFAVLVPDLTGAASVSTGGPDALADAAVEQLMGTGVSVLVGHSGAGAVLSAVAARLALRRQIVDSVIYVDAMLPSPGLAWMDTAPPDLLAHLRSLAAPDGALPAWAQWFPPGTIEELLPDEKLRRRTLSDAPALNLHYFERPMPADEWDGQPAYLQLSAAYDAEARRAESDGWVVRRLEAHHLAMVDHPDLVARGIISLLPETG